MPRDPRLWGAAACAGISALLALGIAMHHAARGPGTFDGRVYGITVALEVAAIAAAIRLLRRSHAT